MSLCDQTCSLIGLQMHCIKRILYHKCLSAKAHELLQCS